MGVFTLRYRFWSNLSRDACISRLSGFADEESLGGLIDFLLTGDQRTPFFVRIRRYRFKLQPKDDPFPFGSTFFAGKLKQRPDGTLVKLKFCYHRLTILLSLLMMFSLLAGVVWRLQEIGWTSGLGNPIDIFLIISLSLVGMIALWWFYFLWERRKIATQILTFLRHTLDLHL